MQLSLNSEAILSTPSHLNKISMKNSILTIIKVLIVF